ncbi:kinase-like protein [Pseudovirgaria hyperparasitica]|uniref:EKC/KEOPS complex subunit BUD32 n=1 Tax=Pseudovirgaria hyperparasitica TaxID=470096 RepID=A0A6A6VZB3_9PEZI|nr:kinase-like protein [Pseudovirgaria hyperparasitica]KAF2755575.1 kinase-like protein [Pseudovirgaria hyperparasitica]
MDSDSKARRERIVKDAETNEITDDQIHDDTRTDRETPSVDDQKPVDFDPESELLLDMNPSRLEAIYDYNEGGHCPIELGNTLYGDRYRVIHKLGNGGFGNVWLCRDLRHETPHYVAVKVLMAELTDDCGELKAMELLKRIPEEELANNHICIAIDFFEQRSPNGNHFCFVYPLLGPPVPLALEDTRNTAQSIVDLKRVVLEISQALACLHRNGICHGDLTAKNILFQLEGIDGLSEAEVFQALGEPQRNPVITATEEKHNRDTAPQYLVYPIDFGKVDKRYIGEHIRLIDFGEAFDILSLPPDIGLPPMYCPPELVLDKRVSVGCDLWALGVTLFEMRAGVRPINILDSGEIDEYLYHLVLMLGKLPEPWWSTTWKARRECFTDEMDSDNRPEQTGDPESRTNESSSIGSRLKGHLFWDWDTLSMDFSKHITPPEELEGFVDLLEKLLRYDPAERLTAREVSRHPWVTE